MTTTTPRRPRPTEAELAVEHEVPDHPGLYVKRNRDGGATLYARWSKRDPDGGRTNVVGGLGPYLNRHDPHGWGDYDDVVDAIVDNVEHWFGWPHRYSMDDLDRARGWSDE